MSEWSGFCAVLKHDLLLSFRHRHEWMNPLAFFVIVVALFPLALTPDLTLLKTLAPGLLWVAALLSTLLSLDHLFRSDYEDGALSQLILSSHSLPILVVAKVLAHWLVTALPLILLSPLLGLWLHLSVQGISILMFSLCIGTPVLSLLGAIGVALTLGLRGGGVLLSLMLLPLAIPVLIFGVSAVVSASEGAQFAGQLIILLAMLIFTITLAPLAISGALKLS